MRPESPLCAVYRGAFRHKRLQASCPARHSAESIGALLGADFVLADSRRHEHKTPWQAIQHFQFGTFRRIA